jgi:hypothetical protein
VPGGPRDLQNRRRPLSVEVGSIPILSAIFLAARLTSRKEVEACRANKSASSRRSRPVPVERQN